MRHFEDRRRDFWVVEEGYFVEDGLQVDGPMATATMAKTMATIAPQIHQVLLSLRTMANRATATSPPGRGSPEEPYLVAHPWTEGLRRKAILVLAGEALVVLKRIA